MSQYKIVFVPRWLDRVAKEMGITNQDLISVEKLSCILSTRDVELYQMANFNMRDCLASLAGASAGAVPAILNDFYGNLAILPLEQRAAYANVDTDTLIYGATATRTGEGQGIRYGLSVELADEDTILVRVDLAAEGPAPAQTFVELFAEKLHGLMTFRDFVRTNVFKQYVRGIQINSSI